MSNIIVEGFGTYGMGDAGTFGTNARVTQAMLSGIWAQQVNPGSGDWGLVNLPWDPDNRDVYLFTTIASFSSGTSGWRRVLPVPLTVSRWSFFYAVSQLPSIASGLALVVKNMANDIIIGIRVETTGAISVVDQSAIILAVTAGPVVVAQTAQHWEIEIDTGARSVKIYVQGKLVLNASGLAFSHTGDPVAQFEFIFPSAGVSVGNQYGGHLIVRDDTGDFNNSFPIGERKVATLFANADDVAHQGWANHPLHRFGNGILDLAFKDVNLTQLVNGVSTSDTTHTDVGSADFTIEGQFRFQSLPAGANRMTIWGKWDEVNNKRSYEFYLGGPDLDHGLLTFRTSTDGMNGTVVNKLQWVWQPDPGTWYEIAFVRASGELLLFIDGVQQGLPIADTDVYFVSDELFGLGVDMSGGNPVVNTNFVGWMDEFRFSKYARYVANYAPHTDAFPRNGADPQWGSVVWLSSWDNGVVADDGPLGISLTAWNGTFALTPNDGAFNYQSINQNQYPFDDNFIEAALVAASALLTYTAVPVANGDVTVGTSAPATPAVYTFRTFVNMVSPFDVLQGATIADSLANLVAAINLTGGAGTIYGVGTTANLDVSAQMEPSGQMLATALIPGTVGNSIATACDDTNGDWSPALFLAGGIDIPPYSQFSWSRLPSDTSIVDSITIGSRQAKTDTGICSTQVSFIGAAAGVETGQIQPNSVTPTVVFDTFETDPDAPTAPLSPTAILLSKVRINRLT